jgi:hypothetical protein
MERAEILPEGHRQARREKNRVAKVATLIKPPIHWQNNTV